MIPLRLSVNNFMCYRDNVPSLNLEDIHVACLCGENGHGKTALLDAMTWALWGQSRAKTQEELIHQGRQDMAVALEFMARDQRYRVSRKYSRSGRSKQGTTLLELQVISGNGLHPITGNTVRETEARLREIIHMDYDTFVNTAFLLQGQADMFTRSSPSVRKECLAEVLDLSYYQKLEERAKLWGREAQDKAKIGESAIELRRQELGRKPEYEQKFTSVKADLALVEPRVVARQHEADTLRESVNSLRARRHELATKTSRLATSRDEIENLKPQIEKSQTKIDGYEDALQKESEIREQYAHLEETRAELERLDKASFEAARLDQKRAKLNEIVAIERERLAGQATRLRSRITDNLEPATNRLPEIEERLRETTHEQAGLEEMEREFRQRCEEIQKISSRAKYLEEINADLLNGMEKTRQKFNMLHSTAAQCPLCEQPLGREGKDRLRHEYESHGTEAKRRYQENVAEREQLNQRHGDLDVQNAGQEDEISRRRQQLHASSAAQEHMLAEAHKAQEAIGPAAKELEQLLARLDAAEFAPEERRALATLDDALSSLGYDEEKHRRIQEQVRALDTFVDRHRQLLEATEALPAERAALESVRQMIERRRQEIELDERQLNELGQQLKSLPGLEENLAEAQSSLQALEKQKQSALIQQGVLAEQINGLTKVETQLLELEQELKSVLDEKGICDELAVAFGKNGIQALIIETAIPQLQEDANQLLGRLTENRMSLKLQLQEGRRERQTGMPSEELEIKIADEVGTRSYETFSGGEAFRINFALRIGLSKLLARRSGAPLPILFIDEGFGSQDSTGQERLKEVIQSIHSDFQKIIVITHIEQIKDAFPVRIEVTKTESGSTFVVV